MRSYSGLIYLSGILASLGISPFLMDSYDTNRLFCLISLLSLKASDIKPNVMLQYAT
jgi:hypothetical protein